MSDTIDDYKAMADKRKAVRSKYGVECPACRKHRPKTNATILLPQQRCKVDRYKDPRPELTDQQWSEA